MCRIMIFAASLFTFAVTSSFAADGTPTAEVQQTFGGLPIYFIENQGQIDSDDVAFYVKGADKTLYFTEDGITFSLGGEDERWTVKLDFAGANSVKPAGADKQKAIFSYFKGAPEDWKAGCPTYAKLIYEDLWPGIDLVFSGTVNRLKYEFIVEPGADPNRIRLAYRGATGVATKASGELVVSTPVAELEDGVPYAFQDNDGARTEVSMAYRLREAPDSEAWEYGFEIGGYDADLPLVLDPEMLVYCGYIGGSNRDEGLGIAVDSSGAVYVAGRTRSSELEGFPGLVGPDLSFNGCGSGWEGGDGFVAKVSPSGTELEYCGYIGGTVGDRCFGIAVDETGAAYVAGMTASSELEGFPVLIGPDLTYNGDGDSNDDDAFVAKISPSGSAIEYCGYIGGADRDICRGIAVDGTGAAYVGGCTDSSESEGFPVLVGPDLTFNDGSGLFDDDAFVAKISPSGAALEYCGYIGGVEDDTCNGVAVDEAGAAYLVGVTGSSASSGFPVLVGPELIYKGGDDVFVAKVGPSGAALEYCGYIGGYPSGEYYWEWGNGIAVDALGAAYVTGATTSPPSDGFPVTVGPSLAFGGGEDDAFVAKVAPSGAFLEYCGYIGGQDEETGSSIAVDGSGAAYVTGNTWSSELEGFPVLIGPDLTYSALTDGFVAKVSPSGTSLEYCGYIGGAEGEHGEGIVVDGSGAVYIAGVSDSSELDGFPVIGGPDLSYNGGDGDAFVAKVAPFHAPLPDVKVNGQDGPLSLTTSDEITVTIALDPRSLDGEPADWWVAVHKDQGNTWWAKYRSGQKPKWTKSTAPIRFAGAPLRTVNSYVVLGPRTLPLGEWIFGFAVDGDNDGEYDAPFIDTVIVSVN